MDSTLWVIIYSKFSPSCRQLFGIIEQSGLNSRVNFQSLCIDDKKMRQRIRGDKRFNIRYVPCVVNVNQSTGVAAQYEGMQCFELINEIIAANLPNANTNTNEAMNVPQHLAQREQKPASISFTPLTQDEEEPSRSLPEKMPHRETKDTPQRTNLSVNVHAQAQERAQAQAKVQAKKTGAASEVTSIEDLLDLDENTDGDYKPAPSHMDRPDRRNPNKVSVSSVMASRESFEDPFKMPSPPELDVVPKRTGTKVSVAEIMAERQ